MPASDTNSDEREQGREARKRLALSARRDERNDSAEAGLILIRRFDGGFLLRQSVSMPIIASPFGAGRGANGE
jgi:hypothetical protein